MATESMQVQPEADQPQEPNAEKPKRKRSQKNDGLTIDLATMGLQSFKIEKLNRADLKGAPYNPRILTPAAKRKLTAVLKKHGLVSTITWNRRTGNIVGGHQRIEALDALAGTSNYEMDVAVIDVDEAREKELNIALNNQEAGGDFDLEKLQELLRSPGVDVDGTGFDHSDIFKMFGDSVLMERDDGMLDAFAQRVRGNAGRLRRGGLGARKPEQRGFLFGRRVSQRGRTRCFHIEVRPRRKSISIRGGVRPANVTWGQACGF